MGAIIIAVPLLIILAMTISKTMKATSLSFFDSLYLLIFLVLTPAGLYMYFRFKNESFEVYGIILPLPVAMIIYAYTFKFIFKFLLRMLQDSKD